MEQRYHTNTSNNGFLLGLMCGVLLTLLFVTSKGRKILKMLTEEGIDRIEDLEKLFKEKMETVEKSTVDEEEIVGNDYIPPEPLPVQVTASVAPNSFLRNESENNHESHISEEVSVQSEHMIHRIKPSPRRFFKGVPKKN